MDRFFDRVLVQPVSKEVNRLVGSLEVIVEVGSKCQFPETDVDAGILKYIWQGVLAKYGVRYSAIEVSEESVKPTARLYFPDEVKATANAIKLLKADLPERKPRGATSTMQSHTDNGAFGEQDVPTLEDVIKPKATVKAVATAK